MILDAFLFIISVIVIVGITGLWVAAVWRERKLEKARAASYRPASDETSA